MNSEPRNLRLDGIYKQRQEGFFMQRVKLPAGVISAEQACKVAAVADRFGRGTVHLTTRGSMEIHWLKEGDLLLVKQELAKVGLTSRGACGGAVRGVTCSSQGAVSFPGLESLARRLQRHFTGNPRFEGLPKKFKIGIEADCAGGRHLIQDVGLVLAGSDAGVATYDVWIAGGLGREPRPGFLLASGVREERLLSVIEAVVAVYARLAPPPKRLKFLARELGEDELRRLIEAEPVYREVVPQSSGFADNLTPAVEGGGRLVV
ncbi:MAG TPA: nitrite/sulfite reductase, partial [Geobacteraceae bacterium]|nr:nitrite/sulfite reductase [Geobacteraceae bacterium]